MSNRTTAASKIPFESTLVPRREGGATRPPSRDYLEGDMAPALQRMAAAAEAHLLAIAVDVVVAGNTKYERLRHTAGRGDGVEEPGRQPLILALTRVGDVARREDEVRVYPFTRWREMASHMARSTTSCDHASRSRR